jgi:hypothetical protein
VVNRWMCVGLLVVGVAAGCDSEPEFAAEFEAGFGEGEVWARENQWNDFRLNDFRLNDFRLNGAQLNTTVPMTNSGTGESLQFWDFDSWDYGVYTSGGLVGGMLRIGGWIDEWDVEATYIDFQYKANANASPIWKEVWIDYAYRHATMTDVWAYDLELRVNGGPWDKLCRDANGNPTTALMLADVWAADGTKVSPRPANAITFACRGAALAKCVEFGYRPWATKNGVALADYHQACTRMVRADYCGDGVAHTTSGTMIHVLDQIGIQNQAVGANYTVEAEWGPNGATCLNPGNTRLAGQPPIVCANRTIPTCGTSFASGGLIQSGKLP